MPRLPIGPANIAPPLRCERLEDRSLLSSTTLFGVVGDPVPIEPMPCEVLPVEGLVLEEGGTVVPFEIGTIRTAEWLEGRDGFLTEEAYYEEDWSYEDEYWDDSWYYEDELDIQDVYVDSDGMTWEEYEEVWLDWDRSNDVPAPAEDAGDWSWTLEDFGGWTDPEVDVGYAMTVSGSIVLGEVYPTAANSPAVDLLPLPDSTPEVDSAPNLALALPPGAADLPNPPELTETRTEKSVEAAALPIPEQNILTEADPPALAATDAGDDHLTGAESLELNEDLRVG